jgi:hypothetical protein
MNMKPEKKPIISIFTLLKNAIGSYTMKNTNNVNSMAKQRCRTGIRLQLQGILMLHGQDAGEGIGISERRQIYLNG